MRILVIYADVKTACSLKKGLEEKGYEVTLLINNQNLTEEKEQYEFDVIILDENVESSELLAFARRVCEVYGAPMLKLSEVYRSDLSDADLKCFYLITPFEFYDLIYLIEQIVKSKKRLPSDQYTLQSHDLIIDIDKRIALRAGMNLRLTPKEFDLIQYLLEKRGRAVALSELALRFWKLTANNELEIVKKYMHYLSKKVDSGQVEKLIGLTAEFEYFIR